MDELVATQADAINYMQSHPGQEREKTLEEMTVEELRESIAKLRARRAVARERRRVVKTGGELGPDGTKPKRVRKGRAVIEDIDDDTMSMLLGGAEASEDEDEAITELLG